MLAYPEVKNYAIIESIRIDLTDNLNIITGETGAGKSILLGALSLILGKRADTSVLFDSDKKCIVEGGFTLGDDLKDLFEELELDHEETTTIRREISTSGKSRAFINDTPVNLSNLKLVAERLVDLHQQHETPRIE